MPERSDVRDHTTADNLMAHVCEIARYVRPSGGPDEAKAFDYIESCLQQWGVHYSRITHPAFISLPRSARLSIEQDCTGQSQRNVGCITHSMSALTDAQGCRGKLVDVGAGTLEAYESISFAEHTAHGPVIALVDGLATPDKTVTAKAQGAAGVVFVNGDELHEMIVSPVWGSPSSERLGLLPNIPVVSVLWADGLQIRSDMLQGAVYAVLHTDVVTEWREIPMLIAEVEGQVYPNEVVLLSGHVDSWHYGAMDNASANAVQLEVLRIFKERQHSLQRTLQVAFWSGHSHGRYAGSTWYVDHHFEEIVNRVVLHMYIDSVGGQGATVLSEAWAMSETKQVAVKALAAETGEMFNGSRFGRGGDQSFYGAGVSCLYMCLSEQLPDAVPGSVNVSQLLGGNGKTGGLGAWWHAVDDTVDKLNPKFLLRDARIYLSSLDTYLAEARLQFDFRETALELAAHLTMWQDRVGTRFSLQVALDACAMLQRDVNRLYEVHLDDPTFNRVAVGLSRRLVPLNYSTGNRFEHDLAHSYPPIPALQPIEELVESMENSDHACHTLVLLQRRCNYVTHVLLETTAFLHDYIKE